MGINTVIYIIISLFVIIYILSSFKGKKRMPILLELFFIGIYAILLTFAIFPSVLSAIEIVFGIENIIALITYISIIVAYFMLFILYQKDEVQRVEISKLSREIAFLKKDLEDKKKK